ncbi:MAG: thiamine-phosphate kinase [Candidatus Nanopelagicales bacterium]
MAQDSGGTVRDAGEFGLIDRITSAGASGAGVIVGPGDDTAVVATPDGSVAVTCDVLVEGVHFRRDWSTPVDVGRKSAAASLADIAAMGARPTAIVVGLGVPGDLPAAWAVACAAGLREEAASVGASLVGGDVVEAPQVVISVTALGDLEGRAPVLRSGARPGDVVAYAGRLGWSAAGLALLSRGFRSPKALVDAHRCPQPDYAAGVRAACAGATAMIDVSDGLVADAQHVAVASGVDLLIQTQAWQVPEPMAAAAAAYNIDPREWMLTGGEDHALLATFPAGTELPEGFVATGVVARPSDPPGVLVDGKARAGDGGHRHFG